MNDRPGDRPLKPVILQLSWRERHPMISGNKTIRIVTQNTEQTPTNGWPSGLSDIHLRLVRQSICNIYILSLEEIRCPGSRCVDSYTICEPWMYIGHLIVSKSINRVRQINREQPYSEIDSSQDFVVEVAASIGCTDRKTDAY